MNRSFWAQDDTSAINRLPVSDYLSGKMSTQFLRGSTSPNDLRLHHAGWNNFGFSRIIIPASDLIDTILILKVAPYMDENKNFSLPLQKKVPEGEK